MALNKSYIPELGKLIPKILPLVAARITDKDSLIKKVPAYPPLSATVHLTENCNSKCITCGQWQRQTGDEFTTEEAKDVLRQLRDSGCKRVGFSGGESLLRNDIGEIIGYAGSLGFERISLVTNGLLLDKKKEELVENGITSIAVSIDGMGETHDKIRGIKGYFDIIMKAIDGVKELQKRNDFSLEVNTTLLRQNADDIPLLLDMCQEKGLGWGINLLNTSPYIFQGIDSESLWIKDEEKIDELIDYITARKKENEQLIGNSYASIEYAREYLKTGTMELPCYLGMMAVYIGSQGEVYSGCYVLEPLGNLREKKLADIMTSPEYKERILKMYRKQCPGCTCNYGNSIRIDRLLPFRRKSTSMAPEQINTGSGVS